MALATQLTSSSLCGQSATEADCNDFSFVAFEATPEKTLFLLPYIDDLEGDKADAERPFNAEERDGLEAVARYMSKADYAPALVLAARTGRAREAMEILSPRLLREPAVFWERAVHFAQGADLIERLRCISNFIPSVLLIAGRRALADLAARISRGYGPYGAREARHRMMHDFPEGSLAALSLAVDSWSAVGPKSGLLRAYVRPADLRPRDH
jgi:phosphohistidine phosphatase SixA